VLKIVLKKMANIDSLNTSIADMAEGDAIRHIMAIRSSRLTKKTKVSKKKTKVVDVEAMLASLDEGMKKELLKRLEGGNG